MRVTVVTPKVPNPTDAMWSIEVAAGSFKGFKGQLTELDFLGFLDGFSFESRL